MAHCHFSKTYVFSPLPSLKTFFKAVPSSDNDGWIFFFFEGVLIFFMSVAVAVAVVVVERLTAKVALTFHGWPWLLFINI